MVRDVILEADGGSRGNPGPAAYGAVIRDARTGSSIAELGEYIGEATNNVAEYRGLLAGLEYLAEFDEAVRVEARLDSKLIVEQMSGRWKIKHPEMRRLALAAREAMPFESISYVWVPRHQNTTADAIVNECLDIASRLGASQVRREY